MGRRTRPICLLSIVLAASSLVAAAELRARDEGKRMLAATGVQGGLVVHLGCGDGTLTAALRASDSYMVHGLDADAANVQKARAHIQSLGLYGPVCADRWTTAPRLPYIDNLVNLVVASVKGQVSSAEIARVLAPRGRALVRSGSLDTRHLTLDTRSLAGLDGWSLFTKPVPREIDDWTHYLYDASNNAVSHDTAVGPPRHFQWLGSPRYSRHHDHMSGASAMASAGGRLFYIFDHASPQSVQLPSVWRLVARDAFPGTVLWSRPIKEWYTQMFRLKSGPAQLTRRLVAVGDRLYVTLGISAPVSMLDGVTGKTLLSYEGSANTEELLVHGGVLLATINDKPFRQPANPRQYSYNWPEGPRRIAAYEAATGKLLWSKPQPSVLPLTLCADDRRAIFHDGQKVACLDKKTGRERWRSQPLKWRRPLPTSFAPTLVLYRDVVLFSGGGTANKGNRFRPEGNVIYGLSAEDGHELWNAPHPPSGHRTAQDTLVVGGLAWLPAIAHGSDTGELIGHDPRTGEVKKKFLPDVETHWFHHRCHRAKATDNYLLLSRTGIEFVDPKTEHWECHHWVRGACLYGVMPANGMIHNPPHPCACYLEAKLYGFTTLAPGGRFQVPGAGFQDGRLEKGPAYGANPKPVTRNPQPADWPTYRHDPARSGATKTAVPSALRPAWERELGGRLSSVVVAAGKLFVASIDTHTVHALDAATGKPAWAFTAGGRVDSPPTIWQGRCLFGSADGYVYCLRASDGALAWRFRAAPMDRRMGAFEQLESVWPVHGSVLIRDGELWCVAGRSVFVDGGLRLVRLSPATGKLVGEAVLDDRDPASGKNLQVVMRGLNMAVALPDVLSCDAKYVYMRSQRFDGDGKREELEVPNLNASDQRGATAHLFSPTGFLDDIWWHRSYWIYGRVWKSGAGGYSQAGRNAAAGRPMVFDDARVYGYGRKPQYYRWTTPMEYMLFASARQPKIVREKPAAKPQPKRRAAAKPKRKKGGLGGKPASRFATDWAQDVPVLVRAMVLADRTIFFAGPADLVDETQSLASFGQEATQKQLARQAAALDGAEGAVLWAVSTDGEKLAELTLPSVPVFDGMAAAGGRLYVAMVDGTVRCLGAAAK